MKLILRFVLSAILCSSSLALATGFSFYLDGVNGVKLKTGVQFWGSAQESESVTFSFTKIKMLKRVAFTSNDNPLISWDTVFVVVLFKSLGQDSSEPL